MERHGVKGTFFFLGEVAERFPGLVRRVAEAGNEIGSHGYRHRHVMQMTRREFRDDVSRSLHVIEDATGGHVRGYRAPYFSIKADVRWPIEILADLGVRYDASILAIDRPPGLDLVCPRRPFRHANGLWEVPVAVLQMLYFWHLPLASGTALRLLPRWLVYRGVRQFERDVGPGVFYLHPWELDPDSPAGTRCGSLVDSCRAATLCGEAGDAPARHGVCAHHSGVRRSEPHFADEGVPVAVPRRPMARAALKVTWAAVDAEGRTRL